jgi:hypothetical protein
MAYTPPNTFVATTTLEADELKENFDALKDYLHGGVISSDLTSAKWVQTKHVQPPTYEPFTALQHGVTGIQGGQWPGGIEARMSFISSSLTGQGTQSGAATWVAVPGTAVRLQLRRDARILYHYWIEKEAGPDDLPYTAGLNYPIVDRLVYVCPYITSPQQTSAYLRYAQTTQNNQHGSFASVVPFGAEEAYTSTGSWGQRDGTIAVTSSPGEVVIGLAAYSQMDRVAVPTYAMAVEVFYL